MKTLIPAAAYYRMSSDRQEASIGDQRRAVVEFAAKNGYRIVKEYVDEGISGWRNDREAFQRLITDAAGGTFKAVLCWDQDRFSRFPPLEANHYWFLLETAGVHLTTVSQGRLDFSDLAGWLTASISQHAKSEYCRDLGRNVARGQRTRKLQGQWIGKAPFGLRLGDNGFLVEGEPHEIDLIRRIFTLRGEGSGTKWIAQILNREKIPAPRGGEWSSVTIREILRRDAYRGHAMIGKKARGKYARLVEQPTLVENVHPAIVSQEAWDLAREVDAMKMRKHHHGDGEGPPLGGLLICGDCGDRMHSHTFNGPPRKLLYECGRYRSKGMCFNNHVEHSAFHAVVYDKLRDALGLESLKEIKAIAAERLAKQAAPKTRSQARGSAQQLRAIDLKIANAVERLVTVPPSLVSAIEAKLIDLQQQRSNLTAEIEPDPESVSLTVSAVVKWMTELNETLTRGRPSQIRHQLSRIIKFVRIDFEPWKTTRTRTYRRPVGGLIQLSDGEQPLGVLYPNRQMQIPLTAADLSGCYRKHAWNYKGGDADSSTAT